MSDLIERQAAIDALNTLFKKQVTQFGYEGYEKADEKTQIVCDGISYSIGCVLNLPTAQPRHYHEENLLTYAHDMGVTLEQAEKELTKVSQIAPQRIKGRWIRDDFGSFCESCGLYAYLDKFGEVWESNYCPNCGADMRGEQDG